jgi:hypothetical protein
LQTHYRAPCNVTRTHQPAAPTPRSERTYRTRLRTSYCCPCTLHSIPLGLQAAGSVLAGPHRQHNRKESLSAQ